MARQIAQKNESFHVLVAARKIEEAQMAIKEFNCSNCEAVTLDVTSEDSVKSLHDLIEKNYPNGNFFIIFLILEFITRKKGWTCSSTMLDMQPRGVR